jgi:glycosyltransferase involved in cell wall biosynthesis
MIMTYPELDKLLDELGISSPTIEEKRLESYHQKPARQMPLVMSIGETAILESLVLSSMWRRFEITPVSTHEMSIISLIKFVAKNSRQDAPVVIIVGQNSSLLNFLSILISAKYYGRKVHVVIADSALESLTPVARKFFARLLSYANRVVCFSARESSRLRSDSISAEVLYPIVASTMPQSLSRGVPQPKVVCCVLHGGSELSTLTKAFSLVKRKYPRAELTILTDSCNVECENIVGVKTKPVSGNIDELSDSFDIHINLSSLTGGFLPFMLAQAARLPTIATDFGDVRELAIHKHNALICRLNDPVSLADAIITLVEQDKLRDTLVQNSALCCNDYSFDTLKDDWARFLGLSI